MKFDNLEIGHYYTLHDDGLYKVIDKGVNWVLMWNYSFNHKVAVPWIYKFDDDMLNRLEEDTDDYNDDIFEYSNYNDYNSIKSDY